MNKCNSGIFVTNYIPNIITLMVADDIASRADTVVQLQRQINAIEDYSNTVGMSINLKKTKVVVFKNGGPLRKSEKWFLYNKPIETVLFIWV